MMDLNRVNLMQVMSYNQDAVIDPNENVLFFWGGYSKKLVISVPGNSFLDRMGAGFGMGILSFCCDPTRPQAYDGQEYEIFYPEMCNNQVNWKTRT